MKEINLPFPFFRRHIAALAWPAGLACLVASTGPVSAQVVINPVTGSTVMTCPEGPTHQCSGNSVLRVDNGVTLTSSGVQVYGRSTNDLAPNNTNLTGATGLAPATGGLAEVRLAKDANAIPSAPVLLLSNLGLTWDGRTERPPIIENFGTTQGRTQLAANGTVADAPLPPPTNFNFFDFALRRANGTQANYANNRYFPRAEPMRCPAGQPCPTSESTGVAVALGDWRQGGVISDLSIASRLHSDGDIRAGAAQGPNGTAVAFPGGDGGIGLPNAGTKGYRSISTWNYHVANLATWVSQDTVDIAEWGGGVEHNKNRRGVVAFGAVTDPAAVPVAGAAGYAAMVVGWYTPNGQSDPVPFRGTATVVANFVTRQLQVIIGNTVSDTEPVVAVPATIGTTVTAGAANSNVANYATGTATAGTLTGGISVRFFGPVATGGTQGVGPTEIAGAFQLSNAQTGATITGGLLGRKP